VERETSARIAARAVSGNLSRQAAKTKKPMTDILQPRTANSVSPEAPRFVGAGAFADGTSRGAVLRRGWWILPAVLGGLAGWTLIIAALVGWAS
jgi:hypothetical protein